MKVYVSTDGCEVGQLYSAHVLQKLLNTSQTFVKATDPGEADVVVFYACGLTGTKQKASLFILEALKAAMKPSAKLIVWGCLSKQNPELLCKNGIGTLIGPVDSQRVLEDILRETGIAPNTTTKEIPDANIPIEVEKLKFGTSSAKTGVAGGRISSLLFDLNQHLRTLLFNSNSQMFYIRIAEGCESHCTYCTEHLAWGRVRSKPIDKIVSEFENGLQQGYTDFFLCAEDLGAYGKDVGLSAIDLLEPLVNFNTHVNYRLVINEISPVWLKERFSDFEKIFATGKIGTLGCQVESGSNRILKLMGRRYRAEEWRNMMLYVNRKYPQIKLATHFMVGFPTETEEDFKATVKLLGFPLHLHEIIIFKFSPGPNIPASRLSGQVPDEVKEWRSKRLQMRFRYMYPLTMATSYLNSFASRLVELQESVNHSGSSGKDGSRTIARSNLREARVGKKAGST